MLLEVFRYVTPITGSVTAKLREDWQLINVMKDLNWDKYHKLGLTDYETNKDGDKIRVIKDWTKRNDHRHHAMDALTVAFTKHSHIQYYNFLNARRDEKHKEHTKIVKIENNITETIEDEKGTKKKLMKAPMPLNKFRAEAKKHLENTFISFKTKNKVVTRNKNTTKKKIGENTKIELTPRGQLHKETVYGKSQYDEAIMEKVGAMFDEEKINLVAKKTYREALLKRLIKFENNPKKAFGGKNVLAKNPVYINKDNTIELPEKIKLIYKRTHFTIRKEVSIDLFKDSKKKDIFYNKIENDKFILDKKVREVLTERYNKAKTEVEIFNKTAETNKQKKVLETAFTNLDENPIWLNKERGIQLKRVTITGVSNAKSLHYKKDHKGKEILDENGKPTPIDYVSTGNNHHVAIYRDENGNLHEEVVSFYEAVIRRNQGLPIVFKTKPKNPDWEFLFTMKQNEMFIFPNEENGFNPSEIDLLDERKYSEISPNLFRVQKIGSLLSGFWFRHHLETTVDNKKELKNTVYKVIQSANNLKGIIKVRINHLGKIVKVGEY
jgi:CRISPR-associated endonuclease Csn1